MFKRIWQGALLLILLLIGYGEVAAQEGVAKWLRYEVTLAIQQNSGITVEEIQEVSLASGTTTLKRVIPTDKLENIQVTEVLELHPNRGQRTYQPADTGAEYTFQVIPEKNQQTIQLFFPPNNVPTTKFVLKYFVVGALSFYDTGDQIQWEPFGDKASAPIDTSITLIKLPAEFSDEQVIRDSVGVETNKFFSEANQVKFVANNIATNDPLEISVSFPHGVIEGSPPSWQQEIDTFAYWTPTLGWGSVILGLLFLVFGPLVVYGWWYMRIRVSPGHTGKIPKYIKSPPNDLSPAVAGALLDGKVNPRHIMATLLDMAQRGILNIDSSTKDEDSFLPDDEVEEEEENFNLYGIAQDKATRPYEANLYGKIFGYAGAKKRQLLDIRQTLFMSIPELKNQIDLEIAQAGYFSEGRDATRRQYAAFGGAGIMMSIVLGLLAAVIIGKFTYLVVCPFLSIAVGAVALIIAGYSAPIRTEAGAKQAVGWEAFKRYLQDMGVKEAAKYRHRFAQLTPYAVAFGLEKEFVEKFAAANAPVPKWWGKPEEKLPDVSHGKAHAWVSSTDMAQPTASQPKPKEKGVIRRLSQPAEEATPGTLLKHILPTFQVFLNTGHEIFSKAPPIDEEEEVDFEALA
jgi:hypothetical protein